MALAVLGGPREVRDWGLRQSAIARPSTTVFGHDAAPTVWVKAAALRHSLVRNHALVIAVAEGRLELPEIAAALQQRRSGGRARSLDAP